MLTKIKKIYNKNFKYIGILVIIFLIIYLYILPSIKVEILMFPRKIADIVKIQIVLGTILIYMLFIVGKVYDIEDKIKSVYSVSKDYHEYSTYIIEKIRNEEKKEARLLEYTTSSIKDILDALDKNNYKTKILIHHPENAINRFQERKIWTAICDFHIYLEKYSDNFEIRCYKNIASLRARHIGENISVGHYLYHNFKDSEEQDYEDILGHLYPMITYNEHTSEGKIVLNFFNKYFDKLWDCSESIDEICKRCKDEYRKKVCPKDKNYAQIE
jgi:hypothetical protein